MILLLFKIELLLFPRLLTRFQILYRLLVRVPPFRVLIRHCPLMLFRVERLKPDDEALDRQLI